MPRISGLQTKGIGKVNTGALLSKLSPQQKFFVAHLLEDPSFNAADAARKAGYKSPTASKKLMSNISIQKYLGKEIQKRLERCELKAEAVLKHLVSALYLDPLDLFEQVGDVFIVRDLNKIPKEVRQCITGIKTTTRTVGANDDGSPLQETVMELKLMSKDAALNLSMKHLGLLDERISIDHGLSPQLMAQLLAQVGKNPTPVITDNLLEDAVDAEFELKQTPESEDPDPSEGADGSNF